MPLIRYQLGDYALVGDSCPCGRALPVLSAIWGRAYDFVVGADGRRYHGEFFMYLIEDLRRSGVAIGAFQVQQTAADRIEVVIVPAERSRGDEEPAVVRLLSERLPGMQVRVSRASSIPRKPSGKMQLIVNHLLKGSGSTVTERDA
jgi:phenylacetate-CoA ligase